jgi:hypothetical protein
VEPELQAIESIVVYRSILLLNQLHNIVFGKKFVLMVKLCGVLTLHCHLCHNSLTIRNWTNFLWNILLYVIAISILIIPGAEVMSGV